jgi:hypothetical protein
VTISIVLLLAKEVSPRRYWSSKKRLLEVEEVSWLL